MQTAVLDDPQIVLIWLTRLRWLAVLGQIAATAAALVVIKAPLPVLEVGIVVTLTALTNLGVSYLAHTSPSPRWLIPAVVLLDIALLTAVLFLTGGWRNPFAILYVVHVAIAVVLLGRWWTWVVVAVSGVCYTVLLAADVHTLTAGAERLPPDLERGGALVALLLVMALIAYFVGRVQQSLRMREAELALVRQRADRSARFAAVTALAAGAAHELGSPLGTIAVVAKELELSAKQLNAGEGIIDDSRLIRTEVDRCRDILNRMRLEVGDDLRYRAGVMMATDFIEGACVDLRGDQRARLRTEVMPDAQQFWLNSRAVLRALGVMLRNAFEASKPDQTVTLRLRRLDDRHIAVDVEDAGSGMAPEVLKRAGEPFFTTKEMGRGMGMGLFLVKLVAEQNGGRLDLRSELGKGTRATLIVPDGSL